MKFMPDVTRNVSPYHETERQRNVTVNLNVDYLLKKSNNKKYLTDVKKAN